MGHADGSEIIIVGAGIAGLITGRELAKAGSKVTILEAAARAGGRIKDSYDPDFPLPLLLGAEFVHGKLPLTLSLLSEAGIPYYPAEGSGVTMEEGRKLTSGHDNDGWSVLMEKLGELKTDMSLSEFLKRHLAQDEYSDLRESALRLAKGFDAADPDKVSAIGLMNEWQQEEDEQYRVKGGYGRLIEYLVKECHRYGCEIRFQSEVNRICRDKGIAEVFISGGECLVAQKVVITVPVGILRLQENVAGALSFYPPLPEEAQRAIREIGFGAVVKVILHFRNAFWEEQVGADIGFIFSKEKFPTWWTQLPERVPVLTGWMAGPDADAYQDASDDEILQAALSSLAVISGKSSESLAGNLTAWKVYHWGADPYARGAYTYPSVAAPEGGSVLAMPVDDIVYFAGEAVYNGGHGGTVEAALSSAFQAIARINKSRAGALLKQC